MFIERTVVRRWAHFYSHWVGTKGTPMRQWEELQRAVQDVIGRCDGQLRSYRCLVNQGGA